MTDKHNPDLWNQTGFDIRGLVSALKAEDSLVRQRAAIALQGMNAVAAIPAIQKAELSEDDPETRKVLQAAMQALKTTDDESVNPRNNGEDDSEEAQLNRLIAKLNSAVPEEVLDAVEKLGDTGNKIAVEGLILAFKNQKHTIHVRHAIAEALLKLESAPVEVTLLANIRNEDWQIRRSGAAILGQLKADWAVEPLTSILSDPHPVVRRTAMAALKHIGTPESRKALAAFISDDKPTTTKSAATPKQVSGIEVKRPGKKEEENEESSLLKRLEQEREAANRGRGTQPLDPDGSMARKAREIEATQPIRDSILDDLEAILGDDDE